MPIAFPRLVVPNPLRRGEHAGLYLDVGATVVVGAIEAPGEVDYYAFSGRAGDLYNFEVLSENLFHRLAHFDPMVEVFDSAGLPVAHHAATARSDDDFESRDAVLLDLTLPADGSYAVAVSWSRKGIEDSGAYELFGYRFQALPEPGAGSRLALVLALAALARRRRELHGACRPPM